MSDKKHCKDNWFGDFGSFWWMALAEEEEEIERKEKEKREKDNQWNRGKYGNLP